MLSACTIQNRGRHRIDISGTARCDNTGYYITNKQACYALSHITTTNYMFIKVSWERVTVGIKNNDNNTSFQNCTEIQNCYWKKTENSFRDCQRVFYCKCPPINLKRNLNDIPNNNRGDYLEIREYANLMITYFFP